MPVHTRGHSTGRSSRSPATGVLQARGLERPSGQHLAPAGRGKPLPDPVREKMERALGHDFSRVRVHEGTGAESLGAIAYTRGTDLHFAPGRYSPATRSGQELIGHELVHVVQQQAGRVAVPQGKGAPINADPALEAEADRLGAAAARCLPAGASGASGGPLAAPGGIRGQRAADTAPPSPAVRSEYAGALQRSNGKGASKAKKKQQRIKAEKAVRSDPFHIPSGEMGFADPPPPYTTWHEWAKDREALAKKK